MQLKTLDTIALIIFCAVLILTAYNATAYGFTRL